jgi:beta-hydroxylase
VAEDLVRPASGAAQAQRTAGLEDTMRRPGIVSRALMAFVAWAERLNLRYAKLGNPPVYDVAAFPWSAELEREWRAIRAELDRLLARKDELPGFHEIAAEVRSISTDRDWKTFLFCAYGMRSEAAIRACPETWRILRTIPGLKAAMFSIFEPGKHLPAHRGPYNGVLRLHLGLMVPDAPPGAVAIRVADRVCGWEEGRALIFDDAYEHEAWNRSNEVRVVLFVDFVKPLRFPADLVNRLVLGLAVFTPFVREGYEAQKRWEKRFFGLP